MSETDVSRLSKKLDDVQLVLARIEQKLSGYEEMERSVVRHDKEIELAKQRCQSIQSGKTKLSWGAIWQSVLALVLGGIIMYIVTSLMK